MDVPAGHPAGVVDGKAEQVPGRGGDGGAVTGAAVGAGCRDDDGRWSGEGAGQDVLVLHLFGRPAWLAVRLMADGRRHAARRCTAIISLYDVI
jgi:hypothetical protein